MMKATLTLQKCCEMFSSNLEAFHRHYYRCVISEGSYFCFCLQIKQKYTAWSLLNEAVSSHQTMKHVRNIETILLPIHSFIN